MNATPQPRAKKSLPFTIIGIGASAGGLAPFETLLRELPKTLNGAVVFIQHLLPGHPDLLHEILAKKFPQRSFVTIKDGLALRADKIYLTPPGFEVELSRGGFRLKKLPRKGLALPVDAFFSSLAKYAGERSIAAILSGAGTDGVRGASAIRDAGGSVLVQDPSTAEFSSMPQACIAAGRIDATISPENLGKKLSQNLQAKTGLRIALTKKNIPDLTGLFARLKQKTAFRFGEYKENVVLRRIQRRMGLYGITKIEDYLDLLDKNPTETAQLASDMLIGVTGFFRDGGAWNDLKREVIKPILHGKLDSETIRVWTPACSSGEEPYSIAMMLMQEIKASKKKIDFQVFATDINEAALTKAREGTFAGSFAVDIPPQYLRANFNCLEGDKLQVSKELRDHIVFARQNILIDPPFSKLDLIICRNLLIYLEHQAQEKCISLFHYALLPQGYLFLGNAESVGVHRGIFKSLGKKNSRIYQRISDAKPSSRFHPPLLANQFKAGPREAEPALRTEYNISNFTQEMLLAEYAPPAVTINDRYEILSLSGSVERFLQPPTGRFSPDFISWVPHGMRNRLRGALFNASHDPAGVCVELTLPQKNGQGRAVTLRFRPFKHPIDKTNLFMIVFEDTAAPRQQEAPCMQTTDADRAAMRQLEQQLALTRDELQTSVEEFRSANEELHSSNEELQAANEEMETSREELQSLNEELLTVNNQLQSKIEEQESTNNDLHNFFSSTDIPTLFLDLKMQVKRYTPALSRLTKLVDADIGRPIANLSPENLGVSLLPEARRVLETLVPIRREMVINKAWFIRTLLPYRTSDNRIQGVVITYVDITELKRVEEEIRNLAKFPEENPNPILRIMADGTIAYGNPASKQLLERWQCAVGATLAGPLGPATREVIKSREQIILEIETAGRVYSFTVVPIARASYVNCYGRDITVRKQAEEALRESEEKYRTIVETAYEGIWEIDAQGKTSYCNGRMAQMLGRTIDEMLGKEFSDFMDDDGRRRAHATFEKRKQGIVGSFEQNFVRKDGATIWLISNGTPLHDKKGKFAGSLGMFTDITARKKAAEAIQKSEQTYRQLVNSIPDTSIMLFDKDMRYQVVGGQENEKNDFDKSQIEGKTLREAYPKEVGDVFEPIYQKALRGEPTSFEMPYGNFCYLQQTIPVKDPQGRIFGAMQISTNITKRKLAEERLRESEAKLKAAFASMTDALFIADAEGRLIDFNDEFVRYHRFRDRDECSRTIADCPKYLDVWFADDTPVPPDQWAMPRALRGETAANVEYRLRRKETGETWWGSYGFSPIRDQDGRIVGAIVAGREITELKRAEERLREAHQRTATVLNNIADTFYSLDTQWRFMAVNPAAEKAPFGRPASELLGKIIWEIFPGLVGTPIQRHYLDAAGKKSLEHYESLSPLNHRWYEVFMQGHAAGVDVYMRDVTERKKAEEMIAADLAALTRMHALSARAVEAAGIEPLLQEMMDIAVVILKADKGTLQLLEGETLRIVAQYGHERPFLDYFAAAENVASVCGEATRCGERVVVPDVENSPIFTGTPSLPVLRVAGVRAVQSTPLVTRGGRLLGILTTHWTVPHTPDEHNLWRLDLLARQTADLVEQKIAEESLRESEAQLSAVFNSISETLMLLDLSGVILAANDLATRRLGKSDGDFVGKNLFDLVPSHFRQTRKEQIAELVRTKKPIKFEDRLGDTYLDLTFYPVFDTNGNVIRFVSFALDVTARKRAEEALQKTMSRLDSLISSMFGCILFVGEAGVELANQTFCDYFGLRETPEELVGLAPSVFIQKIKNAYLNPEEQVRRINEIVKNGQPIVREEVAMSQGRTCLRDFIPIFMEGKQIGRLWHHADVTELKARERDLDKLNRTLRALSKSSQAMLRARNEREFMQSVCGVILEDCGYKMVWIGMAENDPEKSVRPVESCGFEEGYLKTLTITWADTELGRGPTGTSIRTGKVSICKNMLTDPAFEPWRKEALARGYASSIALPLMEDGTAFGALMIYSEKPDPFIDEEVRMLTELTSDLAHGITVLWLRQAREKMEDQLAVRAQELAVANKELESFAYSVSHDLRAPLRAMHSFSGMLMEDYHDKLDETGRDYLSRIGAGAIKMNALIDDIMSLSQISRQEMALADVNLSEIVAGILHDLQQAQPKREVEIVIAPGVRASADAGLIRVALTNLLQNAWKYTGKKEHARIEFGVRQSPEGTAYFVRDNGAGFDMRHALRLFAAFVRLHAERDFPGTGIGLAIVNRVIARHGGKVWAEAKPEEGACFWFSLPLNAKQSLAALPGGER